MPPGPGDVSKIGGRARGGPTAGAALAEDGHDLPEDGGLVAGERLVVRVVRHEPDAPVLALEPLDRDLAVDHGGDDVAVLRARLLPYHDPVAVGDRRLDHRVTGHPEQEERPLADELPGLG